MQTTNNLGLKKPGAEDVVNIEDLNSNSDVLDGKFGASPGHGHTGTAGDGPKIGSNGLAAGAATDTVIGSRTVSDTTAPTGDSGTPTTLFGWLANMIKAITGGATWRTLPGMTIAAIKTILDAATNVATVGTLVKRDANGRAKVAAPSAADDIANKEYVDTAVAGATIPDASLTTKGKVQLSSVTNSTSEALAATAKAVKDAYDRGSAGVIAAAAAQSTANAAQTRANNGLPKDGSDPMTGRLKFAPTSGPIGNAADYKGNAEVMGDGSGAAFMAFHRPNSYACYFGLDTDNQLKVGGWSAGAMAYKFWNAGNHGPGSGLDADMLRGLYPRAGFVNEMYIPVVNTGAGTLEIGQFIDFHKPASTNDLDGRLSISANNELIYEPNGGNGWGIRANNQVLEWFDSVGGAWKPVGGIKNVQRGTAALVGSNPYYTDVTISPVNMAKTFVNVTSEAANSTTRFQLISSTVLRISNSNGSYMVSWEVVESY